MNYTSRIYRSSWSLHNSLLDVCLRIFFPSIIIYRYARAYMGIQFFDSDSLLPPPFTFLSVMVLAFQKYAERKKNKSEEDKADMDCNNIVSPPADQTYPQLIFQLLDNAKPKTDLHR